jgi:hypothetical protein
MGFELGIFSSAPAGKINEFLNPLKADQLSAYLSSHDLKWMTAALPERGGATVIDFRDPTVRTTMDLMDGGIKNSKFKGNNLPYVVAMHRQPDILFLIDNSGDIINAPEFRSLFRTGSGTTDATGTKLLQDLGYLAMDLKVKDATIDGTKDLKEQLLKFIADKDNNYGVISKSKPHNVPVSSFETGEGTGTTIIYIPLWRYDASKSEGPNFRTTKAEDYNTFQFNYTPDQSNGLTGMHKYNINKRRRSSSRRSGVS